MVGKVVKWWLQAKIGAEGLFLFYRVHVEQKIKIESAIM